MKSLSAEIADAIPALMRKHSKGVTAPAIAAHLACNANAVRAALDEVQRAGRALVFRYRKGGHRHCATLDHDFGAPFRVCRNCELLFFPPRPWERARFCSKACSCAYTWRDPAIRQKRVDGILEDRKTPERKAQLAAHNKRRWSTPEERERLRAQNRREWSDPAKKAKRAAGIQAAQGTAEQRRHYSKLRKRQWHEDPEYREKTTKAMQKRWDGPELRAACSKRMRKTWQDPEQRPKLLAMVKRNGAKSRERLKGYNQSPEVVAKRVVSRKKTMAARKRNPSKMKGNENV